MQVMKQQEKKWKKVVDAILPTELAQIPNQQ